MIFNLVLNSEIYEKLPLTMCIATKVSKMAKTCYLYIFNKNHEIAPISLNLWGANKCESVIQVYVMHMAADNTQENEKGQEARQYQSDRFLKSV
jgi:hypothetical protein